jgi:hypothetical protein
MDLWLLAAEVLEPQLEMPTTLLIFATGPGALGLLGRRGKREASAAIAAAGSKHLIGFRRDRCEAVFLYERKAQEVKLGCRSLLAQSGRADFPDGCPVLGVKRTLAGHRGMSAFDLGCVKTHTSEKCRK